MEQTLPKYGANQRSGGISGNTLKMIAIITMLIDHIGAGVVEPYLSMNMGAMDGNEMFNRLYYLDRSLRIIGRVAFPIFCFLLVEGFLHTRDVKKYGSRLLLFSLISEVPFDLIFFNTWFYPGYQNVYITLFIGLVVLAGYRRCEYDVVKKMLVAAAGCGSSQEEAVKNIKIGITLYDQYDTFLSEMMEGFTAYAAEKEESSKIAINVEILDASKSQLTQNEQVKSLIEKGCDVVCVNLVDRTEPTTITDLAEKNDVPVIFFNRELVAEDLERWSELYYVGADASESGRLEGELAADAFKNDSTMDKNGDGICQYVVLEGEAGHQDSIVRTEYSVNTMVEQGVETEKLGYAMANWNRAQAQTKTAAMLTQFGGEIELIMANNDDMALGAIDALKASGMSKENWPVVVGIDGTSGGLDAVRNGEMLGTVYNDKEGQAKEMLNLAFALATNGDKDDIPLIDGKYVRIPYHKVTLDNIEEYAEKNSPE